MTILKRFVRTPANSILWLLVLAAAVLLLTIGVNIFVSTENLQAYIDQNFTTIGVVTDGSDIQNQPSLSDDQLNTLSEMDEVLFLDCRGLVGAYSPQLTPVLSVQTDKAYDHNLDYPYNSVVLVGTVSDVTISEWTQVFDTTHLDGERHVSAATEITALLNVEQVISAHDGYDIPEKIRLFRSSTDLTEDAYPQEGKRYIFYGSYTASDKEYDVYYDRYSTEMPMLQFGQSPSAESVELMPDGSYQYQKKYRQNKPFPDMTLLDRPLDEFLAASENELWQRRLQDLDVTLHSLPMLGTQRLESVFGFNQGTMYISEGRSFTEEEYCSGAKVCVISEAVARQNGLSVGDAIPLSQYEPLQEYTDLMSFSERNEGVRTSGLLIHTVVTMNTENPTGSSRDLLNNPFIHPYFSENKFSTQDEQFTIVGIYRQEDWWEETNSYAMTPNVIFAPRNALADCAYTEDMGGVYFSAVLKNGTLETFAKKLEGTDLEGKLLTFDQNYDSISSSVTQLHTVSTVLAMVCLACWVVVIALYILLCQNRERSNLGIMRSVGASRRQIVSYLFISGVLLFLAAVIIGVPCGRILTGYVMDAVAGISIESARATAMSSGSALDAEAVMRRLSENYMSLQALVLFALLLIVITAAILLAHALHTSHKRPRKLLEV